MLKQAIFRLGGKKFKVQCNAFARNIVVDSKAGLGAIKFEIQKDGTSS